MEEDQRLLLRALVGFIIPWNANNLLTKEGYASSAPPLLMEEARKQGLYTFVKVPILKDCDRTFQMIYEKTKEHARLEYYDPGTFEMCERSVIPIDLGQDMWDGNRKVIRGFVKKKRGLMPKEYGFWDEDINNGICYLFGRKRTGGIEITVTFNEKIEITEELEETVT